MKNKGIKIFVIILIVIILVFAVAFILYKSKDKNEVDVGGTINIEYSESELRGEIGEYKAKIILSDDKVNIDGSGVKTNENEIIIDSAGTYYITGSISDASIKIDADKNDDIQLVLDNCSITSKVAAPINGVKCNVLTITLKEGSENTVTDSETYTEFTDTEKSEPDGTIFSKTDLIINGTGKLTVNSNYLDGIVSKDGLKIINSEIEITAKDDGIRGKDYVGVNSANIKINAGGEGIKSTNDTDTDLGYIIVDSGNIDIVSEGDTLHSDNKILINDGEFNLSSGDDGMHADTSLIINGGKINITKSYEGIESSYIEINGGEISVIASDDGINVAGGSDGSSINGRMGQNNFSNISNSNLKLVINGGNITVNASGDGIDSNGSLYIYGGNIFVKGPTSSGDAPLDFNGECVITGGNLVAYGSAGMLESPSNASTQNILMYGVNRKCRR